MKKISILLILCILLVGCAREPAVSEGARAVLNATINTPNSELHNPDLFIHPDMSGEEKEAVIEAQEAIQDKWESLLGQYFSPGSFDLFMNSYIRTRFLADDPIPSKLISMNLVSQDKKLEVVDVQVDVDGAIKNFTVSFRYNDDGLFYRVEIIEKFE